MKTSQFNQHSACISHQGSGWKSGLTPSRAIWVCLGLFGLAITAHAFPPAPHHTLYGMVRNQWGDPMNVVGAEVHLLSTQGLVVDAPVAVSTEPGVNYRLEVPMDSGRSLKSDPNSSGSLLPRQDFQLQVQIDEASYVPIEMVFARPIGDPAGFTRLDLTLGVDSDGDGLPDAWEEAIIALLGGDLAGITPDGDADGDGIPNLEEYLAGTFPFDPNDGFRLALNGIDSDGARIEFFTIRGRTYSLLASTDLQQWTPVSFRVVDGESKGPMQADFFALNYQILRVEVPFPVEAHRFRYFKALVE